MKTEKLLPSEKLYRWIDASQFIRDIVIDSYSKSLVIDREILMPIFETGKPFIVMNNDFQYCRIHQKSVDDMLVLLKSYYEPTLF